MRFLSLEVENMFAYNGLSRLDMADTTVNRNIIFVSGRNGAGKISLLNAVKLIFLDHMDERLRRLGFGGGSVIVKQFVLGVPGRWHGVFNRVRVQEEGARVELDRERRRLDDEWSRLRGGALSDSERRCIEGRIGVLEYQREQLALKPAEALPPEVPFLANLTLALEAFQLLNGHAAATNMSMAGRLHRELADRIGRGIDGQGAPIELKPEQRSALPPVVGQALRNLGMEVSSKEGASSTSSRRPGLGRTARSTTLSGCSCRCATVRTCSTSIGSV